MGNPDSAHAGKTVRCSGELTDDDGEPILNDHGNPEICDTTLTFVDHGRFVSSPQAKEPRERYEAAALRFDCPECGKTHWVCPICSDEDDNAPPGWFRGESTGEQMPCHNCNQREVAAQRRGY